MQRLAADDVVRQFFDELRHERVERFGIFAVRQTITLQRADDLRFVGQRLIVCGGLLCFGKIGNGDGRQNLKWRILPDRKNLSTSRVTLLKFAWRNSVVREVKTIQRFLSKHGNIDHVLISPAARPEPPNDFNTAISSWPRIKASNNFLIGRV